MKNLIWFGIACAVLAFGTLFLPFEVHTMDDTDEKIYKAGFNEVFSFGQFVIYLIVLLVSCIRKNRATAIISFVLCFAFGIYFVILAFVLTFTLFDPWYNSHVSIGFWLCVLCAVSFMGLHLANMVMVFKKKIGMKRNQEVIDDALDF